MTAVPVAVVPPAGGALNVTVGALVYPVPPVAMVTLVTGPWTDPARPIPGALVDGGVARDDGAGVDEDLAHAVLVDAAAGVARVVVTDDAVVGRERPGHVDRVLKHHAAAVGGRDVVGEDHVVERQAGVADV